MAWLDVGIVLGILFAFAYLLIIRMKEKYPALGNWLADFVPGRPVEQPKIKPTKEEVQQVWTDHRNIM